MTKFSDSRVQVRRARADDSRFFWELRNSPDVRALSSSTAPISWNDHQLWFQRVFEVEGRSYFVVEVGGNAEGYVRFDPDQQTGVNQPTYFISVALRKEVRGQGVGSRAITLACMEFEKPSHFSGAIVVAHVRQDNPSSFQAFVKAGFELKNAISQEGHLVLSRTGAGALASLGSKSSP